MEPVKSIGRRPDDGERRDCIHIAIFPAIAAEDLRRGDEVGLVYGTANQIKCMDSVYGLPAIGIVDPFFGLAGLIGRRQWADHLQIKKGERCWVFLYPGSIKGLRHEWQHPVIDGQQTPKSESEDWLRRFADKWNFDYDEMIAGALEKGGYAVARGIDLHSASELDAGDEALFWGHIEKLCGQNFDADHRSEFGWSCTC